MNNFGGFGDEGGLGNIDFSKLGGGEGADLGAGAEGDESVRNRFPSVESACPTNFVQDEELPELEGDEPEKKEEDAGDKSSKPKIEEVS